VRAELPRGSCQVNPNLIHERQHLAIDRPEFVGTKNQVLKFVVLHRDVLEELAGLDVSGAQA